MNEVAKTQNNAVTIGGANPWINNEEDQKDLRFPRAKIFQGTTAEQEKFPDAKGGQVINSLTGELMPETFVPIFKYNTTTKWNPRDRKDPNFDAELEPGAMIWNTSDPTDPRWAEGQWPKDGSFPKAVHTINFMCLFEGVSFPVLVSFAKTSHTAGGKLHSMLAMGYDPSKSQWAKKFKISTNKKTKDDTVFFVYDVAPAGESTEEEQKAAGQFSESLAPKVNEIAEANVEDPPNWDEKNESEGGGD